MPLPSDLATLQTASTFLIIVNRQNEIVFQSSNLAGFQRCAGSRKPGHTRIYRLVPREDTLLRVLTVPVFDDASQPVGHIQVARLLDNFEIFNRVLSRALLISMGAAFASLIMLTILTSSCFGRWKTSPLSPGKSPAPMISAGACPTATAPTDRRVARAFNQTLERLDWLFAAASAFWPTSPTNYARR